MSELFARDPIDQASAIPFRRLDRQLEFCLITSVRKGHWGFPKGIIDPGETLHGTALKEAHEEAGLHGRIVGPPLGQYEYRKWGTNLVVTVLLMEVTQFDDAWEEKHLRQRRWVRAEQARQLLTRRPLREFLAKAVARLTGQ